MRELFRKIYENTISKQKDTNQMDKRLDECMEEYISRYKEHFPEADMEKLRDCIYYATLLAEEEAFYLGVKYTVKMLLTLLADS